MVEIGFFRAGIVASVHGNVLNTDSPITKLIDVRSSEAGGIELVAGLLVASFFRHDSGLVVLMVLSITAAYKVVAALDIWAYIRWNKL